MQELFEKYKGYFIENQEEDDFILRYLAYKGFYERIISLNNLNINKEKFIEVMCKNPDEYKKIYKEFETNKNINIEEFKNNILNYLDNKQKKGIEYYGQIILNKTFSNKNIYFIDYIRQIEYELFTISFLNFSGYFNIVQDYIKRAKNNNIAVGPGRGSAAGSLISFLTYITDIDPLKFELLFERFLHILKSKDDYPDIDTDFEIEKRYDVVEYVKDKYGTENTCMVGSYILQGNKSLFKDLCKKENIPFTVSNELAKYIWGIEEEMENKLKNIEYYFDGLDYELDENIISLLNKYEKSLKKIFNMMKSFLDFPKQPGVHACGVIISSVPIETVCSCRYQDDKPLKIGFFDAIEFEKAGMLKFDFLGLNNMSIIKNTIKSILWNDEILRKKYGIELKDFSNKEWDNLNWYSMYYDIINNLNNNDNNEVFKIFKLGLTTGVFQFESIGMKRIMKSLKPDKLTELIDINALYRPGPMAYIQDYIKSKHEGFIIDIFPNELVEDLKKKYEAGQVYKSISFFEDIWLKITKETNGIFIFQEQLMFFFYVLGHSYGDADNIRKIYSKIKGGKKSFKDLEKYYNKTISILNEKGIIIELFDFIYKDILMPWAAYGFNKSHAACYAVIAYITAYLKFYYPYEFFSTILRYYSGDADKISNFINDMNVFNVNIQNPDINKSLKHSIVVTS